LVSHLSGIRHYSKKPEIEATEAPPTTPLLSPGPIKCTKGKEESSNANDQAKKRVPSDGSNDSEFPEFLLNKKFQSVSEAMEIFKNDELLSKPGVFTHFLLFFSFTSTFIFVTFRRRVSLHYSRIHCTLSCDRKCGQ
jgi:hypothetical protein